MEKIKKGIIGILMTCCVALFIWDIILMVKVNILEPSNVLSGTYQEDKKEHANYFVFDDENTCYLYNQEGKIQKGTFNHLNEDNFFQVEFENQKFVIVNYQKYIMLIQADHIIRFYHTDDEVVFVGWSEEELKMIK